MVHAKLGVLGLCARTGALASLVVALGCGSDSTGPTEPDTRWAIAWVDNPTADDYAVDPDYSSSTGAAIRSTRSGIGTYAVRFPGLAAQRGWKHNVQVSAYGSTPRRCRLLSSANDGADLVVHVQCHTLSGDLADSQFDILIVPAGALQGRSAFAISPTVNGGTPVQATSYSSAHQAIKIERDELGVYTVTFEGLVGASSDKETFSITAYGEGTNWCKIGYWDPVDTDDMALEVRCFTSDGDPADARFSVLMVEAGRPDNHRLGYVWANSPSASGPYTPSSTYNFNSTGVLNTTTRESVGVYTVAWTGLSRGVPGAVETNLITAYGDDANYCQVGGWGSASTIFRCYAPNGAPVDSRFTAIWIE